jgi:L-threonylcarbamoyladenylate synthase
MHGPLANNMDWHIKRATSILHQGGIVAYPTEGVWGLGCDPTNVDAVLRLLALKQRLWHKGLVLIAADYAQLLPYVHPLDATRMTAIQATWPGAVTWLLPARASTPQWLRGSHDSVAVRVTSHPSAAALCRRFGGAITSTSANLSGRPAARSRLQVLRRFGTKVDYVMPGKTGGRSCPSEIRDGLSGAVVRAGCVKT